MALLKGIGKVMTGGVLGVGPGKKTMAALSVGAFGAGISSVAGPAAMDATMETAFGDANADRYFTGRDLSLRTFLGAGIGGAGGEMLQMTDTGDYAATNAMIPSPSSTAVTAGSFGGMAGVAGGALLGFKKPSRIEAKVIGAGIGALIGGTVGAGVGAGVGVGSSFLGTAQYVRNNQQFFSQSPYSPTGRGNGVLNASGDIVLGMHNSRRGY